MIDFKTYGEKIMKMTERCQGLLLGDKYQEYASADPFHNFRRAAQLQGVTPAQALVGMMDKHVVSIHDMVNEAAEGAKFPAEKWQEKICDNINYLFILWAMTQLLEEPEE